MKVVQTIELTDNERLTVSNFLKLADDISDVAGCSMDEVFVYFADKSKITDTEDYSICALHEIKDIC